MKKQTIPEENEATTFARRQRQKNLPQKKGKWKKMLSIFLYCCLTSGAWYTSAISRNQILHLTQIPKPKQ